MIVRSMSHVSTPDENTWPRASYRSVVAILLPLIIVQAAESAFLRAVNIQVDQTRGSVIVLVEWFEAFGFALMAVYFGRLRGPGGMYLLSGIFTTSLVLFNFRSDFIRTGTFDYFRDSYWPWLLKDCSFALGGFLVGLFLPPVRTKFAVRLAFVCLFVLTILTLDTWGTVHLNSSSGWSAFAPTRQWALAGVVVVASCVLALAHSQADKEVRA